MSQPVSLVAGGARGQGAAHAEALALAGFDVVIAYALDELVAQTAAAFAERGLPVSFTSLDITDAGSWERVVAEIESSDGSLDVLVNNAGIIRVRSLSELPVSEWELIQRVNSTSVLLGLKAAAPSAHGSHRWRVDRQHRLHGRTPRRRGLRHLLGVQSCGPRPDACCSARAIGAPSASPFTITILWS